MRLPVLARLERKPGLADARSSRSVGKGIGFVRLAARCHALSPEVGAGWHFFRRGIPDDQSLRSGLRAGRDHVVQSEARRDAAAGSGSRSVHRGCARQARNVHPSEGLRAWFRPQVAGQVIDSMGTVLNGSVLRRMVTPAAAQHASSLVSCAGRSQGGWRTQGRKWRWRL